MNAKVTLKVLSNFEDWQQIFYRNINDPYK